MCSKCTNIKNAFYIKCFLITAYKYYNLNKMWRTNTGTFVCLTLWLDCDIILTQNNHFNLGRVLAVFVLNKDLVHACVLAIAIFARQCRLFWFNGNHRVVSR